METHDKYRNKVWSECADDIERAEFIECGRAWETGIIARAIEGEIAEAFRFRAMIRLGVNAEGDLFQPESMLYSMTDTAQMLDGISTQTIRRLIGL